MSRPVARFFLKKGDKTGVAMNIKIRRAWQSNAKRDRHDNHEHKWTDATVRSKERQQWKFRAVRYGGRESPYIRSKHIPAYLRN